MISGFSCFHWNQLSILGLVTRSGQSLKNTFWLFEDYCYLWFLVRDVFFLCFLKFNVYVETSVDIWFFFQVREQVPSLCCVQMLMKQLVLCHRLRSSSDLCILIPLSMVPGLSRKSWLLQTSTNNGNVHFVLSQHALHIYFHRT